MTILRTPCGRCFTTRTAHRARRTTPEKHFPSTGGAPHHAPARRARSRRPPIARPRRARRQRASCPRRQPRRSASAATRRVARMRRRGRRCDRAPRAGSSACVFASPASDHRPDACVRGPGKLHSRSERRLGRSRSVGGDSHAEFSRHGASSLRSGKTASRGDTIEGVMTILARSCGAEASSACDGRFPERLARWREAPHRWRHEARRLAE